MRKPQQSAAECCGRCSAGLREVTWSGPCDKSETPRPLHNPADEAGFPQTHDRHDPQPACARVCGTPPCTRFGSVANHDALWAHRNVNLKRRCPCRDSRLPPNDISRCGFLLPRFGRSATRTSAPDQRTNAAAAAPPPPQPRNTSRGPESIRLRQPPTGLRVCWFSGSLVRFAGSVRWSGSVVASGRSLEILEISNHQLPIVHTLRPSQIHLQSSRRQSAACCLLPSPADAPAHGRSARL